GSTAPPEAAFETSPNTGTSSSNTPTANVLFKEHLARASCIPIARFQNVLFSALNAVTPSKSPLGGRLCPSESDELLREPYTDQRADHIAGDVRQRGKTAVAVQLRPLGDQRQRRCRRHREAGAASSRPPDKPVPEGHVKGDIDDDIHELDGRR